MESPRPSVVVIPAHDEVDVSFPHSLYLKKNGRSRPRGGDTKSRELRVSFSKRPWLGRVQNFLVLLKESHLIAETLKRGGRVICLARCGIESFFCFRELGYSSPTNVILVNPEALFVLPAKCKTVGAVFYGFFRQEPT